MAVARGLCLQSKIGIFAGSFDPIHAGHIAFALQAVKDVGLERVVFLPERRPRGKPDIEHFGHRTAMITRAIRPYKNLALLELPDIYFDAERTLPKLQHEFAGAQLNFLMGSDTAARLTKAYWPAEGLRTFLQAVELTVALRSSDTLQSVRATFAQLPVKPAGLYTINVSDNHISSSAIRQALRSNQPAVGLLPSVRRYARRQWLYATPANS